MAAGLDSSTVGLDTNLGLNHTQPYPVHIDLDGLAAEAFFQTYYSLERFIVECVLATLAAGCNVTALVVNKGHTYQHPAYHLLFKVSIPNFFKTSKNSLNMFQPLYQKKIFRERG